MIELGKDEFRREFRRRIAAIPEPQKQRESASVCESVRETSEWRNATRILLFHPLLDEPDIRPLLSEALDSGRQLFLPRYNPESKAYDVVQVASLANDLGPGRFDILEPDPDCRTLDGNQLDFIAVPGLGFDVAGRRLGRGMGFYDRMLSDLEGFLCGLSFDCQLCVEIPVEPHDHGLNLILTPSRRIEVRHDG